MVVAVVLAVAAGALGAVALLVARDDSTVATTPPAPGEPLPAGAPRTPAERGLPAGNVVLLHGDGDAGPALRALAEELAGPPSAALVRAGQAVLVRRARVEGVEARAAGRRVRSADPADPRLRTFAEYWLGRRGS
jgi:hypothetical protein